MGYSLQIAIDSKKWVSKQVNKSKLSPSPAPKGRTVKYWCTLCVVVDLVFFFSFWNIACSVPPRTWAISLCPCTPYQHHCLEVSTCQLAGNSTTNVTAFMPTVSGEEACVPSSGRRASGTASFCLPHALYPWPLPWTAPRVVFATWNGQCSTGSLFLPPPQKKQFHEVQPDRKLSIIPSSLPVRHSLLGCQSDLR